MEFITQIDTENNVYVIEIPKRLTLDTADGLKLLLKESVESERFKIVLDLAKTEYMDSSGLGAMVSKIAQTRANQGDIRLAAPKEYVLNLLELTHIKQILKIFDTKEQAVSSYGD